MYKHYYINENPQSSGEHEIHIDGCPHAPDKKNQDYLGYFDKCEDASKKAINDGYTNVDGCYWCNNSCHTK